jgi:hypothetical protein
VQGLNANGATFTDGTSAPLLELKDAAGNLSRGCTPADYVTQGAAGTIVIVKRGTCARVAKAIYAQQAGALGVIMVNNAPGFPPFEGKITSNPDTGIPYTVTIPFVGVDIASGPALIAAAGPNVTLTNNQIANPGFRGLASFTSFGPRSGDSAQAGRDRPWREHLLGGDGHRHGRRLRVRNLNGHAAHRGHGRPRQAGSPQLEAG